MEPQIEAKEDSIQADRMAYKKLLAALVPPSVMLVFWIVFNLFAYPYSSNFKIIITTSLCLLYLIIPGVLIPSLSAFLVNLFLPSVNNFKSGLRYGIPTLITCFFIYAIYPFIDPNISCPDVLDCQFQFLWVVVIFTPLSIISYIGVAISSLLGTKQSRVKTPGGFRFRLGLFIVSMVVVLIGGYIVYRAVHPAIKTSTMLPEDKTSQYLKNIPTKPSSESKLDPDLIIGFWNCPNDWVEIEVQEDPLGEGYITTAARENLSDLVGDIIMEFRYNNEYRQFTGRHIWGGNKTNYREWGDYGGLLMDVKDENILFIRFLDSVYDDGWTCTRVDQ
jgi:hypothetical protein